MAERKASAKKAAPKASASVAKLQKRVGALEGEIAHLKQVFIKRFSIDPAEVEYREDV